MEQSLLWPSWISLRSSCPWAFRQPKASGTSLPPRSQRQMGEGMSSADGVESQPAWGPADEWARKTPAGSQTGALDTDTAAPAAAAAQQGAGRRLHSQGACVNTVNSPGCGGRRVPGCCHLYSRQASRLDCLSEHIRTRYELLTCTHT